MGIDVVTVQAPAKSGMPPLSSDDVVSLWIALGAGDKVRESERSRRCVLVGFLQPLNPKP